MSRPMKGSESGSGVASTGEGERRKAERSRSSSKRWRVGDVDSVNPSEEVLPDEPKAKAD
jgi:hypothetical protein